MDVHDWFHDLTVDFKWKYACWDPQYYVYPYEEIKGHIIVVVSIDDATVSMITTVKKKLIAGVARESKSVVSRYSQSSFNSSRCVVSAGLLLREVYCRSSTDALGCLSHYLDAITNAAEQLHVACIPWVIELLDNLQGFLLALKITIDQARLMWLSNDWWRCDSLQDLLRKGTFSGFNLTLLASNGSIGRGRRSTGIALG